MAYQLVEAFDSGEQQWGQTKAEATLRYYVIADTPKEADDYQAVQEFANANVPATYANLTIDSVKIRRKGPDVWDCEAQYRAQSQTQGQQPTYPFKVRTTLSITGEQAHITQSYATVGAYSADGGDPPDFGGAIGVTRDRVEGVDIVVPKIEYSEEFTWQYAQVNAAYLTILQNLAGKVNAGTFRGRAPGEVLFTGAEVTQTTGSPSETELTIAYRFAISPNIQSLQVGGMTISAKRGWDYLWVRYEQEVRSRGGGGKKLVLQPRYAYVEQVYLYADFGLLGIGT